MSIRKNMEVVVNLDNVIHASETAGARIISQESPGQ